MVLAGRYLMMSGLRRNTTFYMKCNVLSRQESMKTAKVAERREKMLSIGRGLSIRERKEKEKTKWHNGEQRKKGKNIREIGP